MNNYGIGVEEVKLKSGLKTILLRTPGYKSNCACIIAPVGGRICPLTIDDVEIPTGIAHFLEHRLFDTIKGDAFQLLSEVGCDSNAYTTFDYTCYYFSCTKNMLKGIQVLFDMTTNLQFKEEQVENEKKIIIQEMKMKYDEPNNRLSSGLLDNLFVFDNIKKDIVGDEKDIKRTTLNHLKLVFESFYNVNQLTLIVAGDLPKNFVSKLNKLKINDTQYNHKIVFGERKETSQISRDYKHTNMDVPIPLNTLGIKIPLTLKDKFKMTNSEFLALLSITENVLFTDSARLCKEIRENKGSDSPVYGGFILCKDYAIFSIESITKNSSRFIKQLKEIIKNLEKYVSKDIFERQKKHILGMAISTLTVPENVCMEFAGEYAISSNLFERLNAITSIKYKDVLKLIGEIKLGTPSVHIISKKGN
ncbi:MAG: M16 family metallopeptidase [Bacilli bacterium]